MPLCDTLMRAAEKRFYCIHFSEKILNDASRNLVLRRNIPLQKAERHKQYIVRAFPDAVVEVPNQLIGEMTNDFGDRHVLAAAVVARVDVIVTANLKDFPQDSLDPWGIEVQHPDEFLCSLCDIYSDDSLYELIQEQSADCRNPPQTDLDILEKLERQHQNFVSRILAYKYGSVVKDIAKRTLLEIGFSDVDGSRCYDGTFYRLNLIEGCVRVTDKKNNIVRLDTHKGGIRSSLKVKDVVRFQEFNQKLEEELANKTVSVT
ncbi:PIN domain-containing protein [Phormidium tenue FACHB-886]|nr:PIN domain-containing protein [Phormidium tenue FACHB-886]